MNGTSDGDDISEYEKLRLRRIEENQKYLFNLGLISDKPRLKGQRVNSTPKLAKKRCLSIATPVLAQRIVNQRPVLSNDQYHDEPIEKTFKESKEDVRKKKEEAYINQKGGKNVGVSKDQRKSGRNFASQHRKIRTEKEGLELRKRIEVFFENDSVSRICPSKKEYLQGQIKRKKRLLLDNVKNLYRRFLNETGCSLSFSMFQWLKPFWVVQLSAVDDAELRNTCGTNEQLNTRNYSTGAGIKGYSFENSLGKHGTNRLEDCFSNRGTNKVEDRLDKCRTNGVEDCSNKRGTNKVEDQLASHRTNGVEDFLNKAGSVGQPSRNSCLTDASIVKDSWVVAIYDSLWYPGKVKEVNLNTRELTISFMKPNRQYFVWPSKKDEQKLKINEIICQIDPPCRKSARCFTVCKRDIGKIERVMRNFKLDGRL